MSRRRVLQLGALGLAGVGGGALATTLLGSPGSGSGSGAVGLEAVEATEAARRRTGQVVTRQLRAAPSTVDLGGRTVRTWTYDGVLPGPEIRVTAGDELRVRLVNDLPDPTTVHWHGVALRNDMDGVPGLTQDPVAANGEFDYAFVVPHPGTYFFHPHVGVQLDAGLYAPLVVEDPDEQGQYDEDVVLVLDDWTHGWGDDPEQILDRMRRDGMPMGDMGMPGMDHGGMSMDDAMPSPKQPLGADTGDVAYPAHLVGGRLPQAPFTVESSPGRRIRLRVVNAGSDTAYRFAVGGHRLTVTHTDGFAVQPVEVDTLVLGMGERYDVVVTAGEGAFPIVAVPEGKGDPHGMAVLRTAAGPTPSPSARPTELDGQLLTYEDLRPTDDVALDPREPDRELRLDLQMGDGGRRWLINGAAFGDHEELELASDERVRLVLRNASMMFHPMHVHGHTFALAAGQGPGIRKDTVNVLPMETLALDLQADNPGRWGVHCHNIYHAELGMMTVLSYVA
ncbi:MAG: multicopper oxidase family protein [Actinomycetes bacterium]